MTTGSLYRPTVSKWAAHADLSAWPLAHQRVCGLAHRSHRVNQLLAIRRIAADRDRQLANAKHPEHAELTRSERRLLVFVFPRDGERERVGCFFRDLLHHARA